MVCRASVSNHTQKEPVTALDKLPDLSKADLDEVLANPNMLLRIKVCRAAVQHASCVHHSY